MLSDKDFDEIIEQSCRSLRQLAQDKRGTIVTEINKAHEAGEDSFKLTHAIKLNFDKMQQDDELKFTPAPIKSELKSTIDLEDDDEPELPGLRDSMNEAGRGDSGAPLVDGDDGDDGDDDEEGTEA